MVCPSGSWAEYIVTLQAIPSSGSSDSAHQGSQGTGRPACVNCFRPRGLIKSLRFISRVRRLVNGLPAPFTRLPNMR